MLDTNAMKWQFSVDDKRSEQTKIGVRLIGNTKDLGEARVPS